MEHLEPPRVLWRKSNTPEQMTAWEFFEEVAIEFSQKEIYSALTLKDKLGADARFILPLTRQPDKTEALLSAWEDVRNKEADRIEFDSETESYIEDQPEFVRLLSSRKPNLPKTTQETIRNDLTRYRCAAYVGRLAAFHAQNIDSEVHQPLEVEGDKLQTAS